MDKIGKEELLDMERGRKNRRWKRWFVILLLAMMAILALLIWISLAAMDYLVDIWWFHSLGYELFYWQRLLYRYAVLVTATLLFFLLFLGNFGWASRYLGAAASPGRRAKTPGQRYKNLYRRFRTGSLLVYVPLSFVLSILIALPLFRNWEKFLFYVFGPQSNLRDPLYNQDISYYLFSFPVYILIQGRLFLAFLILGGGIALLYWLEDRLLSRQGQRLSRGAKVHLQALLLLLFAIEVWDFILQRYSLVYTNSHEPLFSGPGFVEVRVLLPLIWAGMAFLAGIALALTVFLNSRKGLRSLGYLTTGFLVVLGLRYTSYLPDLAKTYYVQPNAIAKERPFIKNNIEATLDAYQLRKVTMRDFEPEQMPTPIKAAHLHLMLPNVPLWNIAPLEQVYRQLQELRTYYDFPLVNVGRYHVEGKYKQVFLASRELNYRQLPPGARNWINEHLSYTHGYGVVMTPASQIGGEPIPWLIKGIPPQSGIGFSIERPEIYYGVGTFNRYVIAPNGAGEIDYPKGNANVISDYKGKGGIPVSAYFKRLVFAAYFREKNIFFSGQFISSSKILLHRNVMERIRAIAPFLLLDSPYLVVTPKGLFWIVDAYTTSSWYPASAPTSLEKNRLNYIRNSVKIMVDAYNGTVDFYVFDPQDPIIRAYRRIYPGLFRGFKEMPGPLKDHIRYPRDLFTVQMQIYSKYHQTDPEVFFQEEDIWEFAKTISGQSLEPYFLTLDIIEPGHLDFLLFLPVTPRGRNNLRALAVVGCDPPHYGEIVIYNFPKGQLVYSPSQIHALINEEPRITEQFTLWNQAGSQVERGRIIVLPVGRAILYIQPVYLRAAPQFQIPQLQRAIMSEGEVAVMEKSLEGAYRRLNERIQEEVKGEPKP